MPRCTPCKLELLAGWGGHLRDSESGFSGGSTSSSSYYDALGPESFEEIRSSNQESEIVPADGGLVLDADGLPSLPTSPLRESSAFRQRLEFATVPKFPPVSEAAFRESRELPLISANDIIRTSIAWRLGYGTDREDSAKPKGRRAALKIELCHLFRAVEATEGREAAEQFVDEALALGSDRRGRTVRAEVAGTLWLAFA